MGAENVYYFKDRVRVIGGFYFGKRGRVIEEGATKYLVRFRIGLFRVVDAWIEPQDLELGWFFN